MKNIIIDVLTVAATSAQEVADKKVKDGVKPILNFARTHIISPPEIRLYSVDLSIEFEVLTYYLIFMTKLLLF